MASKVKSGPKTRTAKWGEKLPGKAQPRDRSAGKERVPTYPKSNGL